MPIGLLLFVACSVDPSGRDAVLNALSDTRAPLPQRLAGCARATDPDLHGDCALAVVDPAIRDDPTRSQELCAQVPEGLWRWECHFVAAEAWYHHNDVERAADQCRQAGDFLGRCAQHLTQHPIRDAVGTAGVAGWATSLPAAQKLYAEWSARLGPAIDLAFWPIYFQTSFDRSPDAELSVCATVPAAQQPVCRQVWTERQPAPAP